MINPRTAALAVAVGFGAVACAGALDQGDSPTEVVVTAQTVEERFDSDDSGPSTTSTIGSSSDTDPSTTLEPYRSPSVNGVDPETCRLKDRSDDRRLEYSLLTGFPVITSNFEPEGKFEIALVPIDFDDLPGDSAGPSRVADDMTMVTDWYSMVSGGRVHITWRVHDSWVRIPRPSTDFALERSRSDDNTLALAAFGAADPDVDFTGVRAVMFLLPDGQQFMAEGVQGFLHSEFGGAGGYVSDEGTIVNYAIAGAYFDREHKSIWSYWAHEMGHMFPLPDLYDVRGQWWIGAELEIPGGPFSGFDLMANQDGPSRTLSAWLRFVMGWLDDDQVLCVDGSDVIDGEITLVPIDADDDGIKAVLIPLDDTRVAVVESRRPSLRFDCAGTDTSGPNWRARSGAIVYVADMTVGHGNGFQALVAPEGRGLNNLDSCSAPPQLDAVLDVGDHVEVDGVRVELLRGDRFDTIAVTGIVSAP